MNNILFIYPWMDTRVVLGFVLVVVVGDVGCCLLCIPSLAGNDREPPTSASPWCWD